MQDCTLHLKSEMVLETLHISFEFSSFAAIKTHDSYLDLLQF